MDLQEQSKSLSISFQSPFLREFYDRGFFFNVTHHFELDEIMKKESIISYIGFDCTANSLHIGSLIQIMILRLLQKYGHQVIILLGGGTTKIGDPSGKDEARQILDKDQIQYNLLGIKKVLEKFIKFDNCDHPAIIVNNDDWLSNLGYIDFLRNIGRHFSVNRMLGFDSVRIRLERDQNLSFLEFNYMILQAFDFLELNRKNNCRLQIGGSDQWGNIINGVELVRKINKKEVFGLTSPLLTTADGKKMGKTASGAVWLDSQLLSAFDYFQYFRNVDDLDVIKFLKLFTDLNLSEINKMANLQGQELNYAKEILAFEATKICHGEDSAKQAIDKAKQIFNDRNSQAFIEKFINIDGDSKKIVEILKDLNEVKSLSEARRLIEGKALKINNQLVIDINHSVNKNLENFELAIGKKKFYKIIIN